MSQSGEWIGDLLYPGNPARRTALNTLHQAVVSLKDSITGDLNSYTDILPSAQSLAGNNNILQAINLALPHSRPQLDPYANTDLEDYEEPTAMAVGQWLSRAAASPLASYLLKAAINAVKGRCATPPVDPDAVLEIGPAERAGFNLEMANSANVADIGGTPGAARMAAVDAEAAAAADPAAGVAAADGIAAAAAPAAAPLSRYIVGAGVGLALAVGIDLLLAGINGAAERTQLENDEQQLEDAYNSLSQDSINVGAKLQGLKDLRVLLVARYNTIHTAFMALLPIPGEAGKVFSADTEDDIADAIESQSVLVPHFASVTSAFMDFRAMMSQHADFDANRTAVYFPAMVEMGDVVSVALAERYYQLMKTLDSSRAASATA